MMTINIEPKDHQHALRILAAIYGEEETPWRDLVFLGNDTSEPTVTIEDLRSIVSLKVVDHRDAIKAELARLKAKNVSTLDPSLFEEFKRFLEEL